MKSTMRASGTAPVDKIVLRPWRTPVLSYLGSLMETTSIGAARRRSSNAQTG